MLLTPLVFVAAITLEVLGSYMSVIGLSSKSSIILIVLAIALDFSKVVVASVLYKNWKDLNFLFKSFLIPTTVFLMVITSYGAYAYLLQEFGKTTANGEQISARLNLLESEALKVNARKKEIDAQIANVDPAYVTQKRRLNNMFAKELEYLNSRSIELDKEIPQLKSSQMSDNLQAGTLGSLAKSWGTTPDQTAKILALMMVIVIDPLAIVMLTVGNFLLAKREEEKLVKKQEQISNNQNLSNLEETGFFKPKTEESIVLAKEINSDEISLQTEDKKEEAITQPINKKTIPEFNYQKINFKGLTAQYNINSPWENIKKNSEEYTVHNEENFLNQNIVSKEEKIINSLFATPVFENNQAKFFIDEETLNFHTLTNEPKDTILDSVDTEQIKQIIETTENNIEEHIEKFFVTTEDNSLKNNSEEVEEQPKDLSEEDKLWISKYGMTRDEADAIERPGDYLVDYEVLKLKK